jgi:hypothetical protein
MEAKRQPTKKQKEQEDHDEWDAKAGRCYEREAKELGNATQHNKVMRQQRTEVCEKGGVGRSEARRDNQ